MVRITWRELFHKLKIQIISFLHVTNKLYSLYQFFENRYNTCIAIITTSFECSCSRCAYRVDSNFVVQTVLSGVLLNSEDSALYK